MSIVFREKLPFPKDLKEEYPLTKDLELIKIRRDKEIKNIFNGTSDKFLLIIGPCSADDEKAVLDYSIRLSKLAEEVRDKIFIIPRVYSGKPRTTSFGYKGMAHQPNTHKSPNPYKGLIATRKMHLKVIKETGLTAADEMLYPDYWWYFEDLLSYVTVGARSTEDQAHRLVASGVTTPVGMKNPTSGDLQVMMNSIIAAKAKHRFVYRGWDVKTSGNAYAHAVLRGSVNRRGVNIPNYNFEDLMQVNEMYKKMKIENPAVIVDTNHANSGKKHKEQIRIAKEIIVSKKMDKKIDKLVKGLLVESYIKSGSQSINGNVYGKSITDPCLGWNDTYRLVMDLAEML